jgi:hypothetical protein
MTLTLDDTPCSGEPYCSGELRTTGFYGYGCYEARFKPAAVDGVVSTFFTFAGPYDTPDWLFPQKSQHNEIDIEFLGKDTTQVQLNFWTNDDDYTSHNEYMHALGFDASQAFHNYGFKWTSTGIDFYVDGSVVHSVSDLPQNPTPKKTDTTHKVMMNAWPVDETAYEWAGTFVYPGSPIQVEYDWTSFSPGEDCTMGAPPDPTPTPPPDATPTPTPDPTPTPPPGGGSESHIASIDMALAGRNKQATALITVYDNFGAPVDGATVQGEWSGLVTTGDMSKDTDILGQALFYSGRTRELGIFTFCVISVTKDGVTYVPADNVETCDSISNDGAGASAAVRSTTPVKEDK